MNRYHIKIYIPDNDKIRLKVLIRLLNFMAWQYTVHCTDNLTYRSININDVLLFVKSLKLQAENIFEYYTDEKNRIIKLCFRVSYSENIDLILVISDKKEIITVYFNDKNDDHITLNKNLYVKN